MSEWVPHHRPGYFGRHRDAIVAQLNRRHGVGNWRLAWVHRGQSYNFVEACTLYYEESYYRWFAQRPGDVEFVCSFGECVDNAETNVQSGCDYSKQESYSTHIQDIAVRNVLRRMGRRFTGPVDRILTIRSKDSNGHRYGPGNIPFLDPEAITQPSLCPRWANPNSVEDFWQSNKWVQVRG